MKFKRDKKYLKTDSWFQLDRTVISTNIKGYIKVKTWFGWITIKTYHFTLKQYVYPSKLECKLPPELEAEYYLKYGRHV